MKNVIIAAGLVLIIVLSSVIALTIYSNNSRQNEVEEALTVAVEQALSTLVLDKQYSVEKNEKELVADFTQRLVMGIDSDSNITVNILAVDVEKGLLDVEVVETYKQLNGSTGTASYRKTVILDEYYEDPVEYCTITFWLPGSDGVYASYKQFTLQVGENVIFPGAVDDMDGFLYWSDVDPTANADTVQTGRTVVVGNVMNFYGVFE